MTIFEFCDRLIEQLKAARSMGREDLVELFLAAFVRLFDTPARP
jgi:hypothetical protein